MIGSAISLVWGALVSVIAGVLGWLVSLSGLTAVLSAIVPLVLVRALLTMLPPADPIQSAGGVPALLAAANAIIPIDSILAALAVYASIRGYLLSYKLLRFALGR